MAKAEGSTTVRVSRRTHQVLSQIAAENGRTVSNLLDELAENARRRRILDQYNARMAELMADPAERAALEEERAWLDASTGARLADEPDYPIPDR